MSFRKNALNIQSIAYNASTNSPLLADLVVGGVYEVSTAGKVAGATVSGAMVSGDAYLLVGDRILCTASGTYKLLSAEIKDSTNITYGGAGLFAKLSDANTYINQRTYSEISLTQLANIAEIVSIDIANKCGGKLNIYFAGFLADFSATVGTNITLSGDNIYVDRFNIKANHASQAVYITGSVTHDNGFSSQNTHATGSGIQKIAGSDLVGANIASGGVSSTTANVTSLVSTINNLAYLSGGGVFSAVNVVSNGQINIGVTTNNYILGNVSSAGGDINLGTSSTTFIFGTVSAGGGSLSAGSTCNNIIQGSITTGGGTVSGGTSCSNNFNGAITTGGGNLDCGRSSSNNFIGAVSTGGGSFNGGASSSNYFATTINTSSGAFNGGGSCSNRFSGAITTGGGSFNGGASSSNFVSGAITTGGGAFTAGGVCSNVFAGGVACGAGQLDFGDCTISEWNLGASGTGGVLALTGSTNYCFGQPMPAGTPASGTNTAAFRRVS